MDVHLRLDADADGPVVVKSAARGAVARLHAEAERLARAVHPGVVAVALPSDGATPAPHELRTRYAGEPVSGWAGSLASVAGLGAAVASTLADLHEMGIVHGRLDASHILIGDDGRPRLCGMTPVAGATSADDVADLAEVLAALAAQATDDPAGRPGHRRPWGRRSAAAERRAFALAVDRAHDPLPTRRPTARTFADTLVAAVPGADLPTPGPRLPPAPPPARPGPAATTRWAGSATAEPAAPAYGAVPAAEDGPRPSHPAPGGTYQPPSPPLAYVATPEWSLDDDDLLTRESPLLTRRGGASPSADGIDFGPTDRSRRRRRTLAIGAAALLVAAGAACALAFVGSGGDAAVSRPDRPAAGPRCTTPGPPAPAADVDGDGCPEHMDIAGGIVTAGRARWSLGEPGDLLAVGDWDCHGGATPAVLRPATGDVFVFSSWAAPGDPVTVAPDRRVAGAVGLRTVGGRHGCDVLRVDLSSGASTTVAAPRTTPGEVTR